MHHLILPQKPNLTVDHANGDVVCPHCTVQIITPEGMQLVSGVSACPRCRKSFGVTEGVAAESEIIYQCGGLLKRLYHGWNPTN